MKKAKVYPDGSVSAFDLMAELAEDPEYQAMMSRKDREHRERVDAWTTKAAPIVFDLQAAGLNVQSLMDVHRFDEKAYSVAIPILFRHLAGMTEDSEGRIIASLLVSSKALGAGRYLIEEFEKSSTGPRTKWEIANALSECATDDDFESLARIVKDERHGRARGMAVLALARVSGSRPVRLLIELLGDENLAPSALEALGRTGSMEAIEFISPMVKHRDRFIRQEAKKAIAAITRSAKSRL